MNRILKFLLGWVIIGIIVFLFLSLCNWSLKLPDWNGFSRFLFACMGIFFLIDFIENK